MNMFASQPYPNPDVPWNSQKVRYLRSKRIINAAWQLHQNIKAPFGLCLMIVISAVCLACQGRIDVLIPFGKGSRKPVTIFIMIFADSGERKSAVVEIVFFPFKEYERKMQAKYEEACKAYQFESVVWEEKRTALVKLLQKKVAQSESTDEEEVQLKALIAEQPVKPIKPKLIFEDATSAAIYNQLGKGITSAGVVSGEGGSVIHSELFNNFTLLTANWSGETSTHDTKTGGEVKLENVRLMISMSIQPGTLKSYLEDKGDAFRHTGLASRFIFCHAGSTQGSRYIDNNPGSSEHIDLLTKRIQEILEEPKDEAGGESGRILVTFCDAAKQRFHDYCNWVEQQLNPGGKYEHAKDHASKLPENVARLAALLQYFEDGGREISPDALEDALIICEAASSDFLQWFVPPPQECQDAVVLNDWFNVLRNQGFRYVPKNRVLQIGPNSLRCKKRLDPALAVLIGQRSLWVMREIGNKRLVLDLFPGSLPADPTLMIANY